MKKSKKLLTLLLAALLIFAMVIMVACDPPSPDTDDGTDDGNNETVSDGALISNGTFANATGTSTAYIKTNVTGWAISSSDGSITSSADGLQQGVVDLDPDVYSRNKSGINATLGDPGVAPNTPRDPETSACTDTNALVISLDAAEDPGSIFFAATTDPTIRQGRYYKLSIDVWTHLLDVDGNEYTGAAIVIRGDAFVEYLSINTNQEWQTYEVYIEGSNFEDREIEIELWLGHGPAAFGSSSNQNPFYPDTVNPYLAKGTVFFDNVVLEELEVNEDGVCAEYESAFAELKAEYGAVAAADNGVNDQRYEGLAANLYDNETFDGKMTVISFVYPDPNFLAYREYDAGSTSTSYTRVFDTTKVGDALNYTWVLGKEGLEDDDDFPVYGTISNSYLSYSTDPRGIFDLSKLYAMQTTGTGDDATTELTDMFHKLNTDFIAPDADDFFNADGTYKGPGSAGYTGGNSDAKDTNALLIYHIDNAISGAGYTSNYDFLIESQEYYVVSVWVYIWIPALDAPALPKQPNYPELSDFTDIEGGQTAQEQLNEAIERYNNWIKDYNDERVPVAESGEEDEADYSAWYEDYDEYRNSSDFLTFVEKVEAWKDYMAFVPGDHEYIDVDGLEKVYSVTEPSGRYVPKATLKLSGADVDPVYGGEQGQWTELKLLVQGNALADRNMQVEFWYGEGEWGEDTLYPGGCFFDSLSIRKATDAEIADGGFHQVSVIEEEDYEGFGLNEEMTVDYTALGTDDSAEWYYAKADDRSRDDLIDIGLISYGFASGEKMSDVPALDGVAPMGAFSVNDMYFNVVMMRHRDYTASTLYFKPSADFLTIKPNHFYRLSMWVKTEGITDSTFDISVFDAETDEAINSSATVTGIGQLDDWTEISILFRASATTSDSLYIVVEFGSGDIFTPAEHARGIVYLTAFTFGGIEYSEYNDAATGTYIKKASLASSSSYGSVSNGDFSTISTDNYDSDEDLFDTDGNLIGVADPGSWTDSSAVSPITAPTVTLSNGNLTWTGNVPEVTGYYIFMNGFSDEDGTERDGVVVDYIAADSVTADEDGDLNYTWDVPVAGQGFYVRAIAKIGGKIYISPASTVRTANRGDVGATDEKPDEVTDGDAAAFDSLEMGIVNYLHYNSGILNTDTEPFYNGGAHPYRSTSSENLLMISSAYETYAGYQSTSTTFSANSFYRLSVWVKTVDGAKASVTLQNTSNTLSIDTGYVGYDEENNGRYEGYVGIDTAGVWKRFDLYIATGMNSVSARVELYLGNPYAENTLTLGTGEDATKVSYGLSSGTVYFDDVYLTSIDESVYNRLVYGVEDPESLTKDDLRTELNTYGVTYTDEDFNSMSEADLIEALLDAREYHIRYDEATDSVEYADMFTLDSRPETGSFFTNEYVFKVIVRRTDSFDNFDERDEDEAYQGHESASFDHYTSSSAETGEDDEPTSLYGVYDKVSHFGATDFIDYLLDGSAFDGTDWTTDSLRSFLQSGAGDNDRMVLMMANIASPSGQYYRSASSFSFSATSYYKITFQAKYLALGDNRNANFRFIYDNSNGYWEELPLTPTTGSEYTEYTFYFHNESSSSLSAYLYFNLGSNDAQGDDERFKNFVSGIVLIDNLTIEELEPATEEEVPAEYQSYLDRVAAGTSYATEGGYVNEAAAETPSEDEPTDGDDGNDGNTINPQVWLIISSVVIGVIIIAVIVVLAYRKLKDKVKKKLKKTKVESKVPTDLEERAKRNELNRKLEAKKKEIDDLDDYQD